MMSYYQLIDLINVNKTTTVAISNGLF